MNNLIRLSFSQLARTSHPIKSSTVSLARNQKFLGALKLRQFSRNSSNDFSKRFTSLLPKSATTNVQQRDAHDSAMTMPKKRIFRKRRSEHHQRLTDNGYYNVTAFSTAESYDLEKLLIALRTQDLYEPKKFFNSDDSSVNEPDVLYAVAKYQVGKEPRDIFFFREGTVIMWNFSDMESSNILGFLKNYEEDSYDENIVLDEMEIMFYNHSKESQPAVLKNGNFYVSKVEENNILEKYTFSNALSLSVKLGIWEANLDRYVDSMAYVTEDLKLGNKIKITHAEMLRKQGELFELRHLINLSSDLLDTPDFYWDREQLEVLYSTTINHFNISKRTRVMNEKLNHCVELADLITSNLNDIHHAAVRDIINQLDLNSHTETLISRFNRRIIFARRLIRATSSFYELRRIRFKIREILNTLGYFKRQIESGRQVSNNLFTRRMSSIISKINRMDLNDKKLLMCFLHLFFTASRVQNEANLEDLMIAVEGGIAEGFEARQRFFL